MSHFSFDAPGVPGWFGHGLYFSEHFSTAQVLSSKALLVAILV
jgi:hypothetical protein